MKLVYSSILAALVLMLIGCSSVTVNTDYDPSVDFGKYKTFKMYEGKTVPGDALARNPLVKKRVELSIAKELEAKGFTKVEAGDPDFMVVAHGGVKEKTQVTDWGGYGWYNPWWGPYGGRVDVSRYEEGTLVIDIVDFKDKEMVWRGLGTAVLEGQSNPEKVQKKVDQYVTQILAKFPPAGK